MGLTKPPTYDTIDISRERKYEIWITQLELKALK